jgi:hypothetical protein
MREGYGFGIQKELPGLPVSPAHRCRTCGAAVHESSLPSENRLIDDHQQQRENGEQQERLD